MAIGERVSESFSQCRGETLVVRVLRRKISSSEAVAGPTAISRFRLGSTSSLTCALPDSTETTCEVVLPPARTATFTFCWPRSLSEICEASIGMINVLICVLLCAVFCFLLEGEPVEAASVLGVKRLMIRADLRRSAQRPQRWNCPQ